ncbi:neuroblast differentiation-associated protein AHNAK isoform X2 [Poecilia formosa]|uniref:neuroblast differentiation-associated protein AHNAK isoform X2 n=1 Tax=Poecilia formosa TaxID=48698 RepID=UPI0007BA8DC4|nr:PREDICTED: neuroblast differentiation-associated protein AHNAK-like isoform X2 [Poecilia formosa]
MCDCFHLAFPNWHAAPSGTGRRLRAPEPATQDDSICEEPTQFAEGERPRPQGSSPVQEYPEGAKYADKECEEHDADHKAGSGHKGKKSGLGSIFERTSTPKMSKLKEAPSPEGGVIVNTAQDGCAEGLVYGGGGKEGIFIKKVVPESPASKSLKVKEGDQILSATVYFDNMSYEDAIQILEHAQAYKLKLCLKRQPDITETEPTIDSDVIPEEDVGSTEMREQGKTRRRGDARISWPKFPSFGKGRKSRFTRSHSSSEADEQRKLELSPTTSDTESPAKSQDALKGKKKHKIKFSGLTRRGRISSSEDQDTDAPTSGQMSSDVQQKQESDTLSPEFPEYPIGETPEVNEQAGEAVESGPVQHKVELVSIDATLKTADQTVSLGDPEGQSGAPKSPDEKKKKKERSELKIKILGKDKSHKKDAKAKSSPKRLKTLGASVETEDLPEAGKSAAISSSESKTKLLGDQSMVGVDSKSQGGESSKLISSKSITSQISLPKVELDISVRKSPKKGDDKTQKGKETKLKQSKKSSPKHKQPELDMSNVANAEEMQKVNDQEPSTITGHVSTTQLPKREDIEIPGMEDMSVKTTVETKADFKKHNKESKAETVQMSIDVDSVKEAVSKLPGFKLPQLDISGVPIPEEITVIDANAQRISVKTPTKVAKPKQEHLTSSDTTASSEISKTIFLTDSRFDFKKSQMEDRTSPTKCKGEEESKENEFETTNGKAATTEELKTSTRPKITMPSFGMSAKSRRLPYIGIDMQKPSFIQENELTMETRKDEKQTGEVICKVKIPELDGIEYIDSTDESFKKDGGLTSFNVSTDTKTILAISLESKETFDKPEDERNKMSKVGTSPLGTPSGKEDISDEGTTKPLDGDGKSTFKWPNLDISVPKMKGTIVINTSKKDTVHTEALAKGGLIPESDTLLKSSDVPKEIAEAEKPQVEIEPTETEGKFDWEASKFAKFGIKTAKIKGPEFNLSLSKKEIPGEAADKLPEASKTEVTPGKGNVYFLKQKMQLEKPGEVKPLQSKGEHVQGGKIKIPKFGVKTTKLAGPEISLSKKDAEVTLPEVKPEIKLTEGSETDVNIDSVRPEEKKGIEKSDQKIKTVQKEGEAKGYKIKMPQLGIALPKVTTHESDLSLSKKAKDLTLPEVKGEIKDLEVEGTGSSTKLDVRAPGIKVETKDVEGSSSKFKMSPFKIPRIGAATPNLSGEVSEAPETHTVEDGPGIDATIPDCDVKIKASEIDGRASKFKIPKFGISLPKLKGSETDTTQSQRVDVDVTLFKGDTEIKLIDAEHEEPGIRLKGTFPQIGVQQDVEYSASKPEITVPFSDAKAEVKVSQVDGEKINFSSPVVVNETPEVEIPTMKAENHLDGQEEKMKLSKIGIKMPKIKGPEFQLGLSSKDTDVMEAEGKVDNKSKAEIPVPTADVSLGKAEILIPSGKVEIGKPEVQTQPTVEGQGGRFKMPKFGITMPKVKGPEAKRDVEVKLTETKTDIKIPDADFEGPDVEQSPSKFSMPTFKLPKLGLGTSDKNVEGDDIDKDIPDEVLEVTIVAPSSDLSNIDVDTHLLESKVEVALSSDDVNKYSIEVEATAPQIKVSKKEKEGSPSKFKMPTFKLPKFGLSVQRSTEEEPPLDKDLKTGEGEITTSGEILSPSLEEPRIDVKAPAVDLKTTGTESEGRGRKFKLPSLGFSSSQSKGPDSDITLPTTDVDVTQPELKAEVKFPDDELKRIETEIETKGPEFQVEAKDIGGSTSKFKMPTFKLPKFGLATQSSTEEVPSFDKGVKISGGETTGLEEVLTVTTEGPSVEIKGTSVDFSTEGSDLEGKGRKFKLPSLSFSVPQAKETETDLSLRTDVEVKVPEVKAEVKLPSNKSSVEVETKALETKDTKKTTEGSPSKFKMPNFKLPKFGLATQTSTGEEPPLDKGVKPVEGKITTSEEVIVVTTEAPTIEIKGPLLELKTEGIDHEEKGKKFKLPTLGFSATEVKGTGSDSGLSKTEVDVTLPEVKAEVKLPDDENLIKTSAAIEIKGPEIKTVTKEADGSPSKFKMPGFKLPKFGLTTQSSTEEGPPLEKAEEDSEPKNTVTMIDTKATEITVVSKDTDGSPSKFKMPTFKLPKFGLATQSSNKQVQDAKTVKGESTTLEEVLTVTTEEPSIKIKGPSVDLRSSETDDERKGSKFKLPSLGFSLSQSKGPHTNISLPKADVDVTAPEVKAEVHFSDAKVEQPSVQMDVKSPEIKADIDITSEVKMPKITLPKFGAVTPHVNMEIPKMTKEKRGDVDLHVDTDSVDLNVKEGELKKYEVQLPGAEAKGEDVPTVELEGKVKRLNWTFPSISFSRTGGKASEVDVNMEAPKAGVTSMETKISDVDVKKSSMVPAVEATPAPELDPGLKKSKFSLPRFSFSKPSLKEPEVKADLPDHGIEVENYETDMTTEFKLSADEDKNVLTTFEMTTSEAEVKSKKFKMPTMKMPRFGIASYEVTTETHISDQTAEDNGSQLGEGAAVIIKGPKIDFKSDAPKSEQPDQETLNTESDSAVQGSPSKFKLPTFKIPRLGLSRSKPEDESVHFEHENNEDQLEMKTEPKEENLSPKLNLTSFGDILKSIDVDFDVRKVDKVDQDVETSKESHEPGEPTTIHIAAKTKKDTTKSPESSSWFKFPKFGPSSPTEQQKIPDKAEQVKDGSPEGETKDEEVSPTLSVQSSDAFADVSSTITSEPVGPFIPSPTKVTVKYSDESAGAGLEEMHSDIITSTTRTELITDVPSLPEKITILSSGVSSSSEDTVRLTSGKIHIITSNIQPTPESQHAKILSAVQVQSAEGFALQSEGDEAPSWMVQDVQSATRTVKHLVQETTTERSENKETVVITKQITHIFGPTDPISGETASSIQRLKDSVHTEKMRFFDEAEK